MSDHSKIIVARTHAPTSYLMSSSRRFSGFLPPSYTKRTLTTITTPIPTPLLKHELQQQQQQQNFQREDHHHRLFDEMSRHRHIQGLNATLASQVRSGDAASAWALFLHLHSNCFPLNPYTFTPLFSACAALPDPRRGPQLHSLMIKTGSASGIALTALMNLYAEYRSLGDSVRVFHDMEFKDVVTWNALLSNFLRHGLPVEALRAFESMGKEGVKLTEFTLCSVLKACTFMKAFPQGKQVHGLTIVMGRDLVILGTALIDFYSNVGLIEEAMKVFSSLNCRKDEIMLNSLISGCLKNRKYETAFSFMSKMRPNAVSFTSGLAACAENSDLWVGKQIHGSAIRVGLSSDTQLCNSLLDMYAKCGEILTARSTFDIIPQRDVVSWTSMIDAYGRHGYGLEALSLYEEMGHGGNYVSPNSVTFLAVLSACAHSGLVEKGRECFVSIRDKHGVIPGPEHYGCFIDMLGKAGLLEEVWCVFDDMVKNGVKPTAALWGSVLNACSLNQDLRRGELATENLIKFEPQVTGNYVFLSNFHAAIGRWDVVDKLRSMAKNKCLFKEAGSSWVTVTGRNDPSSSGINFEMGSKT